MTFALDKKLKADTIFVTDLSLCSVLLMDNALFPWLILVPRKKDVSEIIELNADEQQQLMQEIVALSAVVKDVFRPDKLNVASLGNVVSQLHVHVIARFESDSAWPHPVFGQGYASYENEAAQKILADLQRQLENN